MKLTLTISVYVRSGSIRSRFLGNDSVLPIRKCSQECRGPKEEGEEPNKVWFHMKSYVQCDHLQGSEEEITPEFVSLWGKGDGLLYSPTDLGYGILWVLRRGQWSSQLLLDLPLIFSCAQESASEVPCAGCQQQSTWKPSDGFKNVKK